MTAAQESQPPKEKKRIFFFENKEGCKKKCDTKDEKYTWCMMKSEKDLRIELETENG
jgi:hypothetical protein